jgi:hypothetical protein
MLNWKEKTNAPYDAIDSDAVVKHDHTRQHLDLQLADEERKLLDVALDELGVDVFLLRTRERK